MKVKKFVAPSMPEAMKMIRAELGNDAVILNSKVVYKGGFLGLFAKKNIEVIAAVDRLPSSINDRKEKQLHTTLKKENNTTFLSKPQNQLEQKEQVNHQLMHEINELKSMLKQLSTNVTANFEQYPGPLQELNLLLTEQELSNELRQKVMSQLLEKWYLHGAGATSEEVFNWAREILLKQLNRIPFGGMSFQKKFINIVGPTGVGKTTTLAKIAAECVIKHRKKVAFITTDTYRIAAIDQLKTYAKILNVPLEVCYNINDFRLAKEKFAAYDIVLIDTAGRNFRNAQYVQDLKNVIDFNDEVETFLVLALTAKLSDMKEIYKQFSIIHVDKFIFTKIDETSHYGAMMNLIADCKMGVAYLTNGQNVPDDIMEASPEAVINILLGVERT
jgi:flagellar biosynthesis protein FlhF